jgi:hypothetical protein
MASPIHSIARALARTSDGKGNECLSLLSKGPPTIQGLQSPTPQQARVHQHPPAHHEGWMVPPVNEFLLGSGLKVCSLLVGRLYISSYLCLKYINHLLT